MALRTVTGTILHPDGSAWFGGVVTFNLLEEFATSTQVYPVNEHTETLDSAGQFSTDIGVPTTGTAYYRISKPDGSSFTCYLAAGAAVDLVTLNTIATTSAAQDDLQTLLDAAAVLTMRSLTGAGAITSTDDYVDCTGTFAVTLPLATGSGKPYIIDNISTGVITVTRAGSDTIEGATTKPIYAGESLTFIDRAAGNWQVLGG
jgi:hypothetical protein